MTAVEIYPVRLVSRNQWGGFGPQRRIARFRTGEFTTQRGRAHSPGCEAPGIHPYDCVRSPRRIARDTRPPLQEN